jgi:hypothetical protein
MQTEVIARVGDVEPLAVVLMPGATVSVADGMAKRANRMLAALRPHPFDTFDHVEQS